MQIVTAVARPAQFVQYDGTNGRFIIDQWIAGTGAIFTSDDGYELTYDYAGSPIVAPFGSWFSRDTESFMSDDVFRRTMMPAGDVGDWSTARQ